MTKTILTVILFMLSSCTISNHKGSVVMKINNTEAHIYMENNQVELGSRIALVRKICKKEWFRVPETCIDKRMTEGTVTKLLNDHYSVVKFDNDVNIVEGDYIEFILLDEIH